MHLVQALTLLSAGKPNFLANSGGNFTHCKFGYFFFFEVGLYLPLNFFSVIVLV